jgi:hypothetical protein
VPASGAWPWRAYLGTGTVNARDRIGAGPWLNRDGVIITASVDVPHDPAQNHINKTHVATPFLGAPRPRTCLTERNAFA